MNDRPDLLSAVVAATRARVAAARARVPEDELLERAATRQPDRAAFVAAVKSTDRVNVIAECKRRSPSRGVLRAAYDPVAIASAYAASGAAAISVLTEPMFFDGSLDHLAAIRAAVSLPLLRKDFIVDEYQLIEARACGADAALLIVSALDDATLGELSAACVRRGLAAVIEVHSLDELDRALAVGASLIGVNNRNLRTLDVDVGLSTAIAERLPRGVVAVSESGLRTAAEVAELRGAGYSAFLIGERFMTAADPGAALAELLESANGAPA
jgi:indole-3-glycerol phosphate synthase